MPSWPNVNRKSGEMPSEVETLPMKIWSPCGTACIKGVWLRSRATLNSVFLKNRKGVKLYDGTEKRRKKAWF